MKKPLFKRRTREHIIADLSVNHVERQALLCGFVVQRSVHDYGIDLEGGQEWTGAPGGVQCKATPGGVPALDLENIMIAHTNRRGDVYYLHHRTTRTGKGSYFFSKKPDGDLASTVPEGYEIYEKPNGQVFLRKARPKLIRDEEIALVRKALERLAGQPRAIVEADGDSIVVHLPDLNRREFDHLAEVLAPHGPASVAHLFPEFQQRSHYSPMMRFTLVDPEKRLFTVDRWCFRGSIDDWFPLMDGHATLAEQTARYCPHLGKESFFELM